MKPDDHRLKLQSAAISRGRMYLKSHLGFLPGFPVGIESAAVLWVPLADEAASNTSSVRISAGTLHRAMFGWTKLNRRFPRVFPEIVDDIDAWRNNLPKLLDMLARAVHDGRPLPPCLFAMDYGYSRASIELAESIRRTHPILGNLLNALSWVYCLNPLSAANGLAWLESNISCVKAAMANLPDWKGLRTIMELCELADEEGEKRVAPLLAVLGCPEGDGVPTHDPHDYLQKWMSMESCRLQYNDQKGVDWPEKPPATWFRNILKFLTQLKSLSPKARRTVLDFFGILFPADLLFRWQHWWKEVDRETAALKRCILAAASLEKQPSSFLDKEAAAIVANLKSLESNFPPVIEKWLLFFNDRERFLKIQKLAQPGFKNIRNTLCSLLESVEFEDRQNLSRAIIFSNLTGWLWDLPKDQLARVLRALHLSAIPRNRLCSLIDGCDFTEMFYYEGSRGKRIDVGPERACRALAFWMGDLQQTEDYDWPIAVCKACEDEEKVQGFLRDLARKEFSAQNMDSSTIETAVRIALHDGEFAETVRAAHEACEKDYSIWEKIAPLINTLQKSDWRHLLSETFLDQDFGTLKTLALWVEFAQCLENKVNPPAYPKQNETPPWILRYPAALHASLGLLASIAPDSEKIAANLLKSDFPDATASRREIEALRIRLDADPNNAPLAKRLNNLHQRLAKSPTVSEQRLKNLDWKLRRAIRRRVFGKWQDELRAGLEEKICRLLGVVEFPAWLTEERHQHAFAAIMKLSGWAKTLGLRLLQLRCGPAPWNLADEPANRKFVEYLRQLGIDPQPWLDPPGTVVRVGKNGSRVRLSFESDPLEIFQMGTPFGTCLSPGSCNYFSTLANAADINKHVIFARDDRGQVAGRCLVAIAQNGGLLAFHPYCHNPELGFAEMVGDLLKEMAARMGTAVITNGTVKCLVASKWYDDGAIDLVGQFACLEPDSALRKSLPTVDLSELPSMCETAFAPVPLNSLTLPMLLDLPEFESRLELVLPLLPRLMDREPMAIASLVRAAWLAYKAGETAEATRLLRLRVVPEIHCIPGYDYKTLGILVKIDPINGLKALRATRPRHNWELVGSNRVRSDEQEPKNRRDLFAEAYQMIGRINKAKRLAENRDD